jgi:Zn-dependent protease with chaperone function
MMFTETGDGKRQEIGKIVESGAKADRANRIMSNLVPPYVSLEDLRVRVIETEEWNASAMGNGAIWVYSGLMEEMSDDELAIILGHELAHYTHEHSRRGAKQRFWGQLAGLGAVVGANAAGGGTGDALGVGALLGVTAWQSGYSRDMEDQADRVGLRYAHEGGYDVKAGPQLWGRFKEKYGESDSVTNFFVGSHSRPTDRIRNLEHEISINYSDK